MDVLALHRAGFLTAVAPLGTSLTHEQAELLGRYGRKVFLLYDSDAAGLKATFRAGDTLLAAGVHPMVVSLPPGEDPDSLLREAGPEALSGLLNDAVDVLERKLQILERQGYLESIDGRRRAVDGLLSTLRSVRDPALMDLYLGRAAERTGVRRDTLVSEVARERAREAGPRAWRRSGETEPGTEGPDLDSTQTFGSEADVAAERGLLLLILRDPTLVEQSVERGLDASHFREPGFRSIYVALQAAGPDRDPGSLVSSLGGPEADLLERLLEDSTEIMHPGDVYDEALRRLLNRDQLDRLSQIDRELELADEDQARRLLVEKAKIAKILREAGVSLSFVRSLARQGTPSAR